MDNGRLSWAPYENVEMTNLSLLDMVLDRTMLSNTPLLDSILEQWHNSPTPLLDRMLAMVE